MDIQEKIAKEFKGMPEEKAEDSGRTVAKNPILGPFLKKVRELQHNNTEKPSDFGILTERGVDAKMKTYFRQPGGFGRWHHAGTLQYVCCWSLWMWALKPGVCAREPGRRQIALPDANISLDKSRQKLISRHDANSLDPGVHAAFLDHLIAKGNR